MTNVQRIAGEPTPRQAQVNSTPHPTLSPIEAERVARNGKWPGARRAIFTDGLKQPFPQPRSGVRPHGRRNSSQPPQSKVAKSSPDSGVGRDDRRRRRATVSPKTGRGFRRTGVAPVSNLKRLPLERTPKKMETGGTPCPRELRADQMRSVAVPATATATHPEPSQIEVRFAWPHRCARGRAHSDSLFHSPMIFTKTRLRRRPSNSP